MHNFRDYRLMKKSSFAYNPREQTRAIRSAKSQVSIANNTVKSAASNLTDRAEALEAAVNKYFSRLGAVGAIKGPRASSQSVTDRIASSASSSTSDQTADSLASPSNPHSQASTVSSASNHGGSMSQILVSLKNNTGVIYSLVNKRT